MAKSATPNAPNEDTTSPVAEHGYVDLVRNILRNLDTDTELAARHNGGSQFTRGRIEAYEGLVAWLRGYEGTDLDGLRERFGEQQ